MPAQKKMRNTTHRSASPPIGPDGPPPVTAVITITTVRTRTKAMVITRRPSSARAARLPRAPRGLLLEAARAEQPIHALAVAPAEEEHDLGEEHHGERKKTVSPIAQRPCGMTSGIDSALVSLALNSHDSSTTAHPRQVKKNPIAARKATAMACM